MRGETPEVRECAHHRKTATSGTILQADVSPLIRPLRGHLLPQGEKEACDLLLQQRQQLGLHEAVVVGDVEADDAGALQLGLEAALEFGAELHDEDDVGPFDSPLSSSRRRPGPSGAEGDLFRQGVRDSFALARAAGSRGLRKRAAPG